MDQPKGRAMRSQVSMMAFVLEQVKFEPRTSKSSEAEWVGHQARATGN